MSHSIDNDLNSNGNSTITWGEDIFGPHYPIVIACIIISVTAVLVLFAYILYFLWQRRGKPKYRLINKNLTQNESDLQTTSGTTHLSTESTASTTEKSSIVTPKRDGKNETDSEEDIKSVKSPKKTRKLMKTRSTSPLKSDVKGLKSMVSKNDSKRLESTSKTNSEVKKLVSTGFETTDTSKRKMSSSPKSDAKGMVSTGFVTQSQLKASNTSPKSDANGMESTGTLTQSQIKALSTSAKPDKKKTKNGKQIAKTTKTKTNANSNTSTLAHPTGLQFKD